MTFKRWPSDLIILTILTAAAALTRFWNLFAPHAVVFDEVYFKPYAGDYLTGSYYFDPHPPLGKLLLGGWAWLSHTSAAALAGSDPAVMLRVLPALAGALIIPVFYVFLRQLGASRRIATMGGILLLLENALIVESRFILIDSLLILFGLGAVTAYLAARGQRRHIRLWLIALSGILAGAAAATKWTGLTALGLIGVVWLVELIGDRTKGWWKQALIEGPMLILIPVVVYMSVFAVHFALLPKTGQGDAFMPQRYQATLVGNSAYDPSVRLSFWDKFIDLNVEMRASEDSLKSATHPYGSKWYSWPLMQRPVYYWQGDTLPNGRQGNIYLLGNPLVWWGIIAGLLWLCFASTAARERLRRHRWSLTILGIGYLINFLPFSQIVRVMFLYHYFFALIYSLAFVVLALGAAVGWDDDTTPFWEFKSDWSLYLYVGIISLAIAGFIYFAPLTYGISLSPSQLQQHMWLKSWR